MSLKESNFQTITNDPGASLKQPLVPKPKVNKKELVLQKSIEKLKTGPHPLQRAGILSALLFWWVNPFLWIGNRTTLEQRMIPDVPKRDRVEVNETKLLGAFYTKGSIGSSIVKMYKWSFLKCAVLTMITQGCFCSLALFLYFLIDAMATGKYKTKTDKMYGYGMWYGLIVGTQFVGSLLMNYISCDLSRTGIRLKNSVIFAVYKKILKMSVLNPNAHTEGNITNYVQVALLL